MSWTVCEVQRPLISVAKMVEAGNKVYLEDKNPRVVNCKTGQATALRKQNGVFVLDLWVRTRAKAVQERKGSQTSEGFHRQER